jgi:GTP-binding protein
VNIKAGDGGNGCVSFFRGPHQPVGPPNGGDGGRGGSIIIKTSDSYGNLSGLKFSYVAKNGESGKGKGLSCCEEILKNYSR